MMKKAILTTAIAAMIAGAALTGTAYAKGGFGGRGGFGGDAAIEHIIRALDLDDSQRAEVRRIADAARPQARSIADTLRDSHEQLATLTKADVLDEAALRSLADARGDVMADAMVARVQVMQQIRAVLTPEQLEKMDTMRDRRGKGRHQSARQGNMQ